MFRPKSPNDVTAEEYRLYVKPHFDLIDINLKEYVIPECCAFFIFSAYRNQLEEDSLDIFIYSALTSFNVSYKKNELASLKKKIYKILKIKFGLTIQNEEPLKVQEDVSGIL